MHKKRTKILFISCLAGMGHIRAAKALFESAAENHPELECQYIDAVDYCSWVLRASVVDSYELMIKHWPQLWEKLYQFADTRNGKSSIDKSTILLKQGNQKLHDYVKAFAPDRIIATHFFVPILLGKLAKKIPTDMVVTDYYANRMWLNRDIRHLFVASQDIKDAFSKDHESIIVSGIPISPRFFKTKNLPELRKKFNLPDTKPVVLILSGGTGLIDISKAAENILNNLTNTTVIAVAGKNNPELFLKLNKIKALRGNTYRALEFIDTIDELMALADIIVTKPGGLTISEVLYLKKPLVMINPIPGQEEKNAGFVVEHNYGRLATEAGELSGVVSTILNNPHFLNIPPNQPNPNETILLTN